MICMGMSQVVISLQLDLFVAVNHSANTIILVTINYCVFQRLFFHTEEGLYTRNVCVNRQF